MNVSPYTSYTCCPYSHTYKKIKSGGDIDTRTIAKMCEVLDCQPGDLIEYVKDTGVDKTAATPDSF